jgi:hypothetical protein
MIFPDKDWLNKECPKREMTGWLDPRMDIFHEHFDDDILLTNADTDADTMSLASSLHPLVDGPNFDGFPAISKMPKLTTNGSGNNVSALLYFISIGRDQKVPQLWQVDMPKGENKKQVWNSIMC